MKTVYTAFSKQNFFAREFVTAYALERKVLPLNPFMNWGYFLDDLVPRDRVRKANTKLIEMSDELWQFGEISNGCYHELMLAMKRGMKIRFFTVSGKISEIKPIRSVSNLVFEEELANEINIDKFVDKLNSYIRGK